MDTRVPNSKKSLQSENRRLKNQLEITRQELTTIKQSRAYHMVRLLGHAKNQLRQSPLGFSKKVVKRLARGGGKQSAKYVGRNLTLLDSLQAQYEEWMAFNEPDALELDDQKKLSDSFKQKPLISIITPVFNPPIEVLRELIDSVLAQTYPHFELCLGNFGDNTAVAELISSYAGKDNRVKNWVFTENKGIAANSNDILAKAGGDYIALLDHDDTLSPDALYENIKLINQADYDFIYSDKDKIDEQGNRFEPFFKPGWSPEVMLNANYLTHLNIMKTSLVKAAGGWSSDTDGAQDWDLFLKVITKSKLVGHIPKVLYHWRVISTSTAHSIETKPYALQGQRTAVDKYMKSKNIPAATYHHGAELLLKWQNPKSGIVGVVNSGSYSDLAVWLNSLERLPKTEAPEVQWRVFHSYEIDENVLPAGANIKFIKYKPGNYIGALKQSLAKIDPDSPILITDDQVQAEDLDTERLGKLAGWLDIDGVRAVGARLTEPDSKIAVDCGGLITTDGIRPLFVASPPYHQTPIGNIEWVRNLKVISALAFVSKAKYVTEVFGKFNGLKIDDDYLPTALQLSLSAKGRLVFDPKVMFHLAKGSYFDAFEYYEAASEQLARLVPADDPYGNPNLSADNPLNLTSAVQGPDDGLATEAPLTYQQEALIHAMVNSLTEDELSANHAYIREAHSKSLQNLNRVLFILPGFQSIYAGLNNVFSYADFLRSHGSHIMFGLILEEKDLAKHKQIVKDKFAQLAENADFYAVTPDTVGTLPSSDVAICTQWATAYLLAKYNKTQRKCYFIQDKEASFYPMGTISALVGNTYKFGFYALANTPGLLDWYKKQFGGAGLVIKSRVDLSVYAPDRKRNIAPNKPWKVFFYARPGEPRNAFELGSAALIKLKKKLKDDVEIYTAGAVWEPGDFGLEDMLVNLGKINYEKLPAFYRSMDAGIMFMFSGHPGVVASELMASGCPVVVNQYADKTWNDLYQHEHNCLVSLPTADAVATDIEKILKDEPLRAKLIDNGLKKVNNFYGDYLASCEESIDGLKKITG